MTGLSHLDTPCLVVDRDKVEANAARLKAHLRKLGVPLRLHVKTAKSLEAVALVLEGKKDPITVSTLKEAEQFFEGGYKDILYAVGFAPGKLERARALQKRGCKLTLLTDSVDTARAISGFPVAIEIDTDGHRAGIKPEGKELIPVAKALRESGNTVAGVLTHAGASYDLNTPEAVRAMAEKERSGAVRAAQRLRDAGFDAPMVSVGSTPTAHAAENLDGVTEVRAGVFVFFDLVMAGTGVCKVEDIALSVLAPVIGHQREKNWILIDAGWMALSRDRGTAKQRVDHGYGLVCDDDGKPIPDLIVSDTNQEHGIVSRRGGGPVPEMPVGTLLRILPNHACATAAQHDHYHVLSRGAALTSWERFGGW
ncbi:MAG TPA: alanine racemase [Burkholderiales bacterium]|nr:alanine racemase [Burkholderiales bacterium]